MSTFANKLMNCNVFIFRKKQKKITELNTCDSSDEEDSDGDESIGNMEFPEYVSYKRTDIWIGTELLYMN